jgi:hypothetical protein
VVPIVLLVFVILGAVGYLVSRAFEGDGSGNGTTGGTGTPAAVTIVAAKDFDPFGGDGEHPEAVDKVFDKNGTTSWETSTYKNPKMDKPGVGIYVQLASAASVTKVEVDTEEAGWSGSIYASMTPGTQLGDWGQPLAQQTGAGTRATFTLHPSKTARFVLLWITELPAAPHQLQVSEIRVS